MTQKSETTEDLRVLRTRKLLQQAFIELTVEKGFATLTVRDITKRAMVNRSTFYRHYLDKYDLKAHLYRLCRNRRDHLVVRARTTLSTRAARQVDEPAQQCHRRPFPQTVGFRQFDNSFV